MRFRFGCIGGLARDVWMQLILVIIGLRAGIAREILMQRISSAGFGGPLDNGAGHSWAKAVTFLGVFGLRRTVLKRFRGRFIQNLRKFLFL